MRKNINQVTLSFLVALIILSCNTQVKKNQNPLSEYPIAIKNLKLEKQYDKTKWLLYCIHCDELCEFGKTTKITDTVTFGMLPLLFDNVEKHGDTVELSFYFYYKDSIKCDYSLIRNNTIDIGAAYNYKSDSVLYYLRLSTVNRHRETGKKSRYENPLQPDVISYIKLNEEKLNSWFRNEAIKKGVVY